MRQWTYPWCTAHLGQHDMLLVVDNTAESKVRNQQLRILRLGAEQQILRLQVSVHDARLMDVLHSGENGPDEIRRITIKQRGGRVSTPNESRAQMEDSCASQLRTLRSTILWRRSCRRARHRCRDRRRDRGCSQSISMQARQ